MTDPELRESIICPLCYHPWAVHAEDGCKARLISPTTTTDNYHIAPLCGCNGQAEEHDG